MKTTIPIGLELYSVRTDLKRDLLGTVAAVAGMGFGAVEFYSPYLDWTPAFAKEVRARLDDLGLTCPSTHNGLRAFTPEALSKTVELNQILGSTLPIVASVPPVVDLDGWKAAADNLAAIAQRLRPFGLSTGFHNHQAEWAPVDGVRPMDVVAARTPQDFVLQLDVGPCLEAGVDPVAWIRAHPGRIRSLHCKDWGAGEGRGYSVAFGDGDGPWAAIFAAAETVGGVECYLIEHGHGAPDQEVALVQRGLENWKRLRL